MRLTCPACQAEYSLEVALARDADAVALASLLDQTAPELRPLLAAYLSLHRPAQRRLSIARAAKLVAELLPDIQRQAVARKGRDWAAPAATWRAAIEHMLALRDKGTLTLPLSGHGYLYEVMVGMAGKAEGEAERQHEATLRARGNSASSSAAVVADVMQQAAQPAAVPPPYDPAKGPSRAARELQARIAQRQQARQATDPATDHDQGVDVP